MIKKKKNHKAHHKYWHLSLQHPSVGLLDASELKLRLQSAFLEGLTWHMCRLSIVCLVFAVFPSCL